MRKITAVTLVGIFLAVLIIIGLPQLSDAGEIIYGCVANKDGSLRIVSDTSQCTSKEGGISWRSGVDGMSRVVMGNVDSQGSILDGSTQNFTLTTPPGGWGRYNIQFTYAFNTFPICLCVISDSFRYPTFDKLTEQTYCRIDSLITTAQSITVMIRDLNDEPISAAFTFIGAEP